MAAPNPSDVYETQQEVTRRLVVALAPVLSPFLGVRRTPRLGRAIASAIFPLVQSGRRTSRQLARRVYVAQKSDWDPDRAPIDEPSTRTYELENLAHALDEALTVNDAESVESEDLERAANVADLHVRNAYRNQSLAYVHNDPDIVGWARVDPRPPTCELCRLLISRGPVFKSAKSAGERNKYHKGCTCIPQIVFEGQEESWPGREIYLAERRRYNDATRGLGGKNARRAWREAVKKANGSKSVQERETEEQSTKALS